jgi:hypothetical protein
MRRANVLLIASLWSAVVVSRASATVLIFQPASGAFGDDAPLPAGYGNRVTMATQDGFLYGLGGGTTPNVVTSYGPAISTWDNDFGDLFHVVYAEGDTTASTFEMDLTADPGFKVILNSFDMAAWPHVDYTINSVTVLNESNVALYSQSNVLIEGDSTGPQHTHFDFAGVSGQTLKIQWDATNVLVGGASDSDDVGITNINFSQQAAAVVPAPSSFVVSSMLFGFFGVVALLRRVKTAASA